MLIPSAQTLEPIRKVPARKEIFGDYPNIQGGFQALAYNGDSQLNSFITNGMFKIKVSNKNGGLPTGTTAGSNDFFLNASTVNAIFGRADTVRPDALMGYWLIRF